VNTTAFLTPFASGLVAMGLHDKWRRSWQSGAIRWLESRQQQIVDDFATWPLPRTPIFIAHTAPDEACLYLEFVRRLETIPFIIAPAIRWCFTVVLLFTAVMLALRIPYGPLMAVLATVALGVWYGGMNLYSKVLRSHFLAFGAEGLADNWLVENRHGNHTFR